MSFVLEAQVHLLDAYDLQKAHNSSLKFIFTMCSQHTTAYGSYSLYSDFYTKWVTWILYAEKLQNILSWQLW